MPENADPSIAVDVARWYADHARDLPWRGDVTAWAVLVSEFMLQQTPVARVIPVFEQWLRRWPGPADLAADSPGEAVRMWGKLGYPRRALRLHAAATAIRDEHGGVVPDDPTTLRALPGVGDYTSAAIAAFAYRRRVAVVDTNVRRVLHRAVYGAADAPQATSRSDVAAVDALLPDDDETAATVSIGLMELGALVCTAAAPRCDECPITEQCAWRAAGYPAYDGPVRKVQQFAGTDRQVRGLLMDVLRGTDEPVEKARLDVVWSDSVQRERALASLLEDGLMVRVGARFALPH